LAAPLTVFCADAGGFSAMTYPADRLHDAGYRDVAKTIDNKTIDNKTFGYKTFDYVHHAAECSVQAAISSNDQAREVWRKMEAFWRKRIEETTPVKPRSLATAGDSR
jgi:hypothetical protein